MVASTFDTLASKPHLIALEHRLSERITRAEGRLGLLSWMVGFTLALLVAVLSLLLRLLMVWPAA